MKIHRLLYHLMVADFQERTRRYSFLITLMLTFFAAYAYIPPIDSGYLTLGLGDYRGIYNSAWVGGAVAVLTSALLSLPAFYLVKNAIERDELTGVGQIIATTPIGKITYILGKALSNFVFLAVMVGITAVAAFVMQIIRAESFQINPFTLVAPFIFVALPAMAVVAALAVLFETISWLRGGFGNIAYVVLWFVILITSLVQVPSEPDPAAEPGNDLLGVSIPLTDMVTAASTAFPGYDGTFAIGATTVQDSVQTFVWDGIDWTGSIILKRLMWVGIAAGISLLAAVFFHRFDPALEKRRRGDEGQPPELPTASRVTPLPAQTAHIQLTPLPARQLKSRFGGILVSELRLMLKGARWWWFVVAVGFIAAGIFVPTEWALRWVLPLAWIWPVLLWSAMGSREMRHRTNQLVFTAVFPLQRHFPAMWLAGVVIALVTSSGIAINLSLAGQWMQLLTWVTSALFIPSLALALGTWSGSSKLFEVTYTLLWYIGPVNQVAYLNFMGTSGEPLSIGAFLLYWVVVGLLIGVAWLGRKRQISS
ncbi:MAG: ABC-2 transporter permease [Anaerolinea sp.]|nr:ABC-2 transporter permease [Anaerolinea sp.]